MMEAKSLSGDNCERWGCKVKLFLFFIGLFLFIINDVKACDVTYYDGDSTSTTGACYTDESYVYLPMNSTSSTLRSYKSDVLAIDGLSVSEWEERYNVKADIPSRKVNNSYRGNYNSLSNVTSNSHNFNEKAYQQFWCSQKGGQMEVPLRGAGPNGGVGRADCITRDFAIEVDFAHKWEEAIGQSTRYAVASNKNAGILLIMEKDSDYKYLRMLKAVAPGIVVWTIKPYDLRH